MQKIKKYLPIIIAGFAIVLIIALPLYFKTTKVKQPSQSPSASPVEVLGENITLIPSLVISPTPTPIKKSPTPKPSPDQTSTVSINPILSPTPAPTPTPISTPTPTPTPSPAKMATVEIQERNSYQVELQETDTAFSILLRVGIQNSFSVSYTDYGSYGMMVNCIGGICEHDNYYWFFYYNNQLSPIGASSQPVSDGDITTWKLESWSW